jgi:hypothetical protein
MPLVDSHLRTTVLALVRYLGGGVSLVDEML